MVEERLFTAAVTPDEVTTPEEARDRAMAILRGPYRLYYGDLFPRLPPAREGDVWVLRLEHPQDGQEFVMKIDAKTGDPVTFRKNS